MVWNPGLPLGIRYLNPNLPPTIAYYFEGKGAATPLYNVGSSESGSLDWSIVSKEPASKEPSTTL